jgi:hypothetical protein
MGAGASLEGSGLSPEQVTAELADLYVKEFSKLTEEEKANVETSPEFKASFATALIAKQREIISKHRRASRVSGVRSGSIADIRMIKRSSSTDIDNLPEAMKEKFKNMCAKKHKEYLDRRCNTFMVCVDGTTPGDNAFKVAMAMRRRIDNICLFHSYEEGTQSTLGTNLKSEVIKTKYENILIGALPTQNYSLRFTARHDGDPVRKHLVDLIHDILKSEKTDEGSQHFGGLVPDFLVIGYTGKKNEASERMVMGAATDVAMRSVPMPVIMVKTDMADGPKKFLLFVDNSPHSQTGLEILLAIVGARDTIVCLHLHKQITQMDHEEMEAMGTTKKYFAEELSRYAPEGSKFEAQELSSEMDMTTSKQMVQIADEDIAPDFLVLCPHAESKITSVTEDVVKNTYCNIILCKV